MLAAIVHCYQASTVYNQSKYMMLHHSYIYTLRILKVATAFSSRVVTKLFLILAYCLP